MNLCYFLLSLAAQEAAPTRAFLDKHCLECHEGSEAKAKLDLSALRLEPADPKIAAAWVKIHDRVAAGEMPPEKRERPGKAELDAFLKAVADPLIAADRARAAAEGRSTWRRLNRYEFENSIHDLLGVPWLPIKEMLPEDGEAQRFNKVGDALDISHVQMAQYLLAAETALREAMASQVERPATTTQRYYVRDQKSFANKMKFNEFNRSPERATFPTLDFDAQPLVRADKAPISDPSKKDLEGLGVVAGAYEPLEPKFNEFKAPRSGRYKVRLCAHSVWVAAGKEPKWWVPDLDKVAKGRRPEPITVYAEKPPRQLRRLDAFDAGIEPTVGEMDVFLLQGETIRPDPSRLFRSRPPNWHNPLAEKDGCPGVVYRWLEVEGPLIDAWPSAGHRLLFGELPLTASGVVSEDPAKDADRLIRGFAAKAYRRPPSEAEIARFLSVIRKALDAKASFAEAMLAGYSTVLCSPGFLCLEEKPGPLDERALAARLSYFLWNSPPDAALRALADAGELRKPAALRAQIERMLADPRSRRFVDAFLDYWLDLRRVGASSPDAALYPDYYLDDWLVDAADEEPRAFFAELLSKNLPARHVVASDFVMINERLAALYGLPGVEGTRIRRVSLPAGHPRGGLMTTAAVLKVTANGTTTSPVLRGVWIMERILGQPPPPPPPSVPAVEPDIRGATTIREQLEKHRTLKTCASCHVKIDPAGFALESFDVFGGWRERYRALGNGKHVPGFGKNGQPFEFHEGLPVDASGSLPGGGDFKNVLELKALLLKDERGLARNLARQLAVYATGAPIRFGDRAEVEEILDRAAAEGYGVASIVREIALSGLFGRK